MSRVRSHVAWGVLLAALTTVALVTPQAQAPGSQTRPRRIAMWGSSVALGTGDELNKEGYTERLRTLLAPRGWELFNQSRGGDKLSPGAPFQATVALAEGAIVYQPSQGAPIRAAVNGADGQWHHIVVSHFTARGETQLFVDGVLAGSAFERLEPTRFLLGDRPPLARLHRLRPTTRTGWSIGRRSTRTR